MKIKRTEYHVYVELTPPPHLQHDAYPLSYANCDKWATEMLRPLAEKAGLPSVYHYEPRHGNDPDAGITEYPVLWFVAPTAAEAAYIGSLLDKVLPKATGEDHTASQPEGVPLHNACAFGPYIMPDFETGEPYGQVYPIVPYHQ